MVEIGYDVMILLLITTYYDCGLGRRPKDGSELIALLGYEVIHQLNRKDASGGHRYILDWAGVWSLA